MNFDVNEMYLRRVQAMKDQDKGVGWYQDDNGELYHFDGLVWDVVPESLISRLEYLG